ncbi:MAG: GNAT family N-acetyltransferase [Geminicoccaceae bacterium]
MAEWDVAMSVAEGCPAEAVRAAYYADDTAALQAPGAGLLLAETDGAIVGSAAWWPLAPGIAELGKVFVTEAMRGSGIGDRLVGAVLAGMRADGYRHARLETATFMHAAIRLYARHAFRRCPFFRPPPEGLAALTVAMERAL